jgi:hypothetical protein
MCHIPASPFEIRKIEAGEMMMQKKRACSVIATAALSGVVPALTVLALPGTTDAVVMGPTPVALSGTPAPGGGSYSSFASSPLLNDAGQLAFQANLAGVTATQGLFAGLPQSLQAVALRGNAAPAGGNYDSLLGGILINASGEVAFFAGLTGTTTPGIFGGPPQSIQAAALAGTAAPAGGNYNASISGPLLNDSGQVAILSGLSGGTSIRGIFVGTPGSMQTAALEGTAAPVAGTYINITTPAFNAAGQVAFFAGLTGGTATGGLFVGTPGSVQAAALGGSAAPAGGNYYDFNSLPTLNAAGQVAFLADLTGGTSTSGIFVGTPHSLQAAALVGNVAPAGGIYNGFSGRPSLNATGQVAFLSNLTGGASTSGIFAGAPGALQAVALQGDAAPSGGGAVYSSFTAFEPMNASGEVAFVGTLTGTGVVTANNSAIYAGLPGSVELIVRKGDVIDVDPTAGVDNRTVSAISFFTGSGGEDGRSMSFNDSGVLVYRLTFTDGSSGIFTSSVSVPEPTTVGLFSVASIVLLRRRRRSSDHYTVAITDSNPAGHPRPHRVTSGHGHA